VRRAATASAAQYRDGDDLCAATGGVYRRGSGEGQPSPVPPAKLLHLYV
jgi:hypothetical protein